MNIVHVAEEVGVRDTKRTIRVPSLTKNEKTLRVHRPNYV